MLDTGTSHIRVPSSDFDTLHKLIEAHSQSTCTLNDQSNLECACGLRGGPQDFPRIYFNFQSFVTSENAAEESSLATRYVLDPEDYVTKVGFTCYLKLNRIAEGPVKVADDDSVVGVGKKSWVLGATFLKKYYTVFDLEEDILRIGIVRSPYKAKNSANLWHNVEYFAPRLCLFVSMSYLVYELIFVRLVQQHCGFCNRPRSRRRHRK